MNITIQYFSLYLIKIIFSKCIVIKNTFKKYLENYLNNTNHAEKYQLEIFFK